MERAAEPTRYHALDGVRATAMLLGVVYHSLLFRMFAGGAPPSPMGMAGPARYAQDWLHSFRMPLFFLVSGLFGRMMLEKYGAWMYLRKRWARIGIPLVVGMFTFGPAYILTREAISAGPGPGGAPPMALAPPGVPSLGGFGRTLGDGGPGGFPPRFGPGGGFRPGGPMPGPFGATGGGLDEKIFGASARLFHLNHLWFLWYLLIFATVAPWMARACGFLLLRPSHEAADRFGVRLIRSGLAPIALGVVAAPALMLGAGPFGWSLGLPGAIFRGFPDFIVHLDLDMAFYFAFFLAGWWLHRERAALPGLARGWLPDLLLGGVAFAGATWLNAEYRGRPDLPYYPWIRWGGFTLYSISSASTGFAFLGFFQKYLDRPTVPGRYLADTALWVYLAHQPFVLIGLAWFVPLGMPWWALTAAVSAFSVAACLLMYEAVVRPTPLFALFGPAGGRGRSPAPPLASRAVGDTLGGDPVASRP